MDDSLEPAVVEPLLTGRFGRPYRFRDVCPSTQLLLDASLPEGAVAVCDEQRAGRGRLGRAWEAPPRTSILSSTLLRPPGHRRWAELSLLGGLAAARAVEGAGAGAAAIKWPNDVLVGGAKIAGVLAEAHDRVVVLGVGINVNQASDELPQGATSLRELDGAARARAPILAALLAELEAVYGEWSRDGLAALHADLAGRDALRGRPVAVGAVSGRAAGIDAHGRLVVETGDGPRTVESGHVELTE